LDLNAKLPENGVINPTLKQQYLVTGISFLPVAGVIVKVDYVYRLTGNQNPNLVVDPYPVGLPYFTKQHAINIGLGYSF
jgi:opacity protein-like surface antigen